MRFKKTLATAFFLVTMGAIILYHALSRPVILVVHSYHLGYTWVQEVNEGIRAAFHHKGFYRVLFHYMDAKHAIKKTDLQHAQRRVLQLVDDVSPSLVILCDDIAQDLVGRRIIDRGNRPIVFAGVNAPPQSYGYINAAQNQQHPQVTGVYERIPTDEIEKLLSYNIERGVLDAKVRIIHLADRSRSVRLDDQKIQMLSRYQQSQLVATVKEWHDALDAFADQNVLILLSNYQQIVDDTGNPYPGPKLIAETLKRARRPILALHSFAVKDGALLGLGTAAYEQGYVAGKKALQILSHRQAPGNIPFSAARDFRVYLRPDSSQGHPLAYPDLYRVFARATHTLYGENAPDAVKPETTTTPSS